MVESNAQLDLIFGSLADTTRRDILSRVIQAELSVTELASNYKMSIAGVSKHLMILERAKLIVKRRAGREQMVSISPVAFRDVSEYLAQYETIWSQRYNALEQILKEDR